MINTIKYYAYGFFTARKCVENFFEVLMFRQGIKSYCKKFN